MIDFHCHLDLYPNPLQVVARCVTQNIHVLSVTTVPSAFAQTAALAPGDSCIKTALGLHPELVKTRYNELVLFEALLSRTAFVGEVGLDGSRRHRSTLSQQQAIFKGILRLCAKAGGRVLSLHSRGAANEVLDALSEQSNAGTFVLHWFIASKRQVHRAVELSCWFSVNPAMFSSSSGRAAVAAMPQDRILPESDGPFTRIDGRVSEPSDAWSIVPLLASMWRTSVDDVAARLVRSYATVTRDSGGARLDT
jgi:TatD DNase family protein